RKKGMARMKRVSEICEMEMIMVEYCTTAESLYASTEPKSFRKVSPYIFVSCSAEPRNIENTKNSAIFFSLKSLKASSPNFWATVALLLISLGGGHFGRKKEKIPKTTANIPAK